MWEYVRLLPCQSAFETGLIRSGESDDSHPRPAGGDPATSADREMRVPPGFDTEFKELVRARTDLVELVGESITLQSRQGGRDFVGLCPFHDDHNPSLHVYPERQSYRCWVCDEGGDCFSFVMKLEGLDFREALESLARRARLEMPRRGRSKRSREDPNAREQLYEILAWAEDLFHQCLLKSPAADRARDYLQDRGFTEETIRRFRIGYHPPDWQWVLNRAGKTGYTPQQLHAARLVRARRDGSGYYDDFVDRVLFPIRDGRGRPVAFGGRILPGHPRPEAPKYLNSPESVLFAKSRLLYGLDVARPAIRRSGTAVVVEGYTDCTLAHQHGLGHMVATLGTSLTETHVTALKRLARRVVLVYDGDDAGRMAMERSLAKLLSYEVDLQVLTLPPGLDPADFLAEHGAEAFRDRLERAEEAWDYKLRLTVERYGLETVDARQRVLDEMLQLVAQAPHISGTVREDIVLAKLSQRVGVGEDRVRRRLKEIRRHRANRPAAAGRHAGSPSDGLPAAPQRPDKQALLESELLEILFADPGWIEAIRREVGPEDFVEGPRRVLFQICLDLADGGTSPSFERVIAAVEDQELKKLAVRLDELSREKDIAAKLHGQGPAGTDGGQPLLLEQTLAGIRWRKEQEVHRRSTGRRGIGSDGSSGLDPDDKELLRLLSQYHQQRATG